MILADNITKILGGRKVLTGVSANIEPGTITALIGPSGAGKSTLLRAMSLLDPPDEGKVTIDGREYSYPLRSDAAPASPWPRLTVVFQQLFLWPHLTVRRNITLSLERVNGNADHAYVEELIDLLAMREFVDRYPNEVSLGQRQRAAIARALALRPAYLLMDEITSALDVEYVAALLDHLRVLRNRGVGILLITHFIGFAKRAADHILFMETGRILESGGPEILLHPKTARVAEFLSLVDTAS